MGGEKSVCPICGQPVETVVGRRKTLGAWVPVWGPGPCHNPDCAAYAAPPGTVTSATAGPPHTPAAKSPGTRREAPDA
ncbi:hypothetical protein LK06_022435 [Streptomyces pluripotens]|nr:MULTISPECIES: hypothetical protein [Streptomyces]ARP74368.1 hypothetical protein LK06_022435 [Streptomyces pluripotens]